MIDMWKKVSERIGAYEEETVRFQTELVACPALGPDNGGPGEAEKAVLVERWLATLRPDQLLRIDAPDARVPSGLRPNVLAIFKGSGQASGRVWVLSHLDIVPPGESGLWRTDPFVLVRDGDRIIGRGVEDNHQGLVSSFLAMKALREENILPTRDVGLAFVADEETGSIYGLDYVLKTRPDLFSPEDLIIVPDSGTPDGTMIEVAEKSILWLRLIVSGRQSHASRPTKGVNTLRATARIITALDTALPRTFDLRDELFTIPVSTFEPTKKEANVPNINTIPGEDVFYFDSRVLPAYDLAEVQALVRRVVDQEATSTGVTVCIETVQAVQAPPATPETAPVVAALARAIAEVHGRPAQPRGIGGGTVAAFFRKQGLPAAVWSTLDEQAHAPNESALLSAHLADARILAHVFLGK